MVDDDDDARTVTVPRRGARGVSPRLARAALAVRVVAGVAGGALALVVCMALAGIAVESTLLRICLGLVPWIVVPALLADRLLRRVGGGVGLVVDLTAAVWLALALLAVGSRLLERPLTVEGDRLAEQGHRVSARAAYFLAGVSPTFPEPGEPAAPADAGTAARAGDGGAP